MPEQVQATFEGGVDVQNSPSKVSPNEVVSALNVDFGLEDGAITARRGMTHFAYADALAGSTTGTRFLVRVAQPIIGNSPYYASVQSTMFEKTGGFGFIPITTFTGSNDFSSVSAYGSYAYYCMNASSESFKHNPVTGVVSEWIKQSPTTAPTLTVSTVAPVVIATAWSVVEGTAGGVTGTATGTTDASTNRVEFQATLLSTNLNTNGTLAIHNYGTDFLDILFSDPLKVLRISRDYSIGDNTFTNYFHTEYDLGEAEEITTVNVDPLIEDQANSGTSTTTAISISERSRIQAEVYRFAAGITTTVSAASDSFNTWAVPRTRFNLISKDPNVGGWDNIGAVRVIVETIGTISVQLRNWEIRGCEGYPISDPVVGVRYFEKFVTIDSDGFLLGESAESPASEQLRCQNARVVVVSSSTATGSSSLHGITHRVWYRMGGALPGPMAVGTTGIGTATFTDTMSDIAVLSQRNATMRTGLIRRDQFPGNVIDISEPHFDSLFVCFINNFMVSQPGVPDAFSILDRYSVSNLGDEIQKSVVWAPSLILVNRDSVYEVQGNVFVGRNKNISIVRTASKGSKARKVIIKTPFGIPMIDYDGLYMYQPGSGQAQEIGWLKAKLMDFWRGTSTTDIPNLKGNRVIPLNKSYINECSAAYADGRLYLAYPGGSDTTCKNMLVIDMLKQRVWTYSYGVSIYSLWWDFDDNKLLAGINYGAIARLENGITDYTPATLVEVARSWQVRTRQWTTPSDLRLENLQIQHSNSTATVAAILDSTQTTVVGTLTAANPIWSQPGLLGVAANSVEFNLNGTVANNATTLPTIYNLQWDAEPEPKCNRFFRGRPDTNNYIGDKLWDINLLNVEARGTGTITSITSVDGTAVMTNTIVITTNTGQDIYRFNFPAETYGDVAITTATSTQTTICFKVWANNFGARNLPPRINYWKTEPQGMEEQICDGWDVDINPNGTVVGTCFVDNTAVTTGTFTGTKHQSYTWAIPVDTYGRTIYAVYTGTGFQHYKTWFHLREEPDRWQNYKYGPVAFPANQFLKTWAPTLNPLGTVIGTMSADGVVIHTATFVGTRMQTFNEGIDVDVSMALRKAKDISIEYNASPSGQRFKHYDTKLEMTTQPFGKKTWAITYRKQGGATQLDDPRFYAYDIEATTGTATITAIFDVDGVAYETATWTVSNRAWVDRQAFYPGMREYLFQHRLKSDQDFYVWSMTMDAERTGVKGLSRIGYRGTPEANT